MLSIYLEKEITFQTFRDSHDSTAHPRIVKSTYQKAYKWAKQENEKGAGIYASVNGMDTGRNKKAVTELRAYFVDVDGIASEKEKAKKAFDMLESKLPPSAIVFSKNGLHAYWYTNDPVPTDDEFYRCVIVGLIEHFKGCPRTKDIARVLRLPGFYHMKDRSEPYLVNVVFEDSKAKYTALQLMKEYPATQQPKPVHTLTYVPTLHTNDDWSKVVNSLASWIPRDGEKHRVVMTALGVAKKFGVSQSQAFDDLLPIVQMWPTRTDPVTAMKQNTKWAYGHGEVCTVSGLRSLGVDVPKLSRPQVLN
jgi:hypothetical protein